MGAANVRGAFRHRQSWPDPWDDAPTRVVWFHIETEDSALAIDQLMRRIREDDASIRFVLTGAAQACGDGLDHVLYVDKFPREHRNAVLGFIKSYRPNVVVWSGDGLRPVLFHTLSREGISGVWIDAILTEKSLTRWRWWPRFARKTFTGFEDIQTRDLGTLKRLKIIGVRETGLSFGGRLNDLPPAPPCDEVQRARLAKEIGGRPVWYAANVPLRELDQIIKVQKIVARSVQRVIMIFELADAGNKAILIKRLEDVSLGVSDYGEEARVLPETDVIITDGSDEGGLWHRLAAVSLMAGSFTGATVKDPSAAAALGSAILHGPKTGDHDPIFARLGARGAALEVSDTAQLAKELPVVLAADKAAEMAHAAWEITSEGAEASDRVLALVFQLLDGKTVHS